MDFRSQRDHINEEIRRNARATTIGRVVKVTEHDETFDDSNHEVSVILRDGGKELRRVPVLGTHDGHISVPQKGDMVLVAFLDGTGSAPVVIGAVYTDNDKNRAPLARAGHWRHSFGDTFRSLYLEAEPEDHSADDAELVRMAVKNSGIADPDARIELFYAGDDSKVHLQANDIVIEETEDRSVRYTSTSSQNLNVATETTTHWDTEEQLNVSYFDVTDNGTSGGTTITVQEASDYRVTARIAVEMADTNTTTLRFVLTKNGTVVDRTEQMLAITDTPNITPNRGYASIDERVSCASGDDLEIDVTSGKSSPSADAVFHETESEWEIEHVNSSIDL